MKVPTDPPPSKRREGRRAGSLGVESAKVSERVLSLSERPVLRSLCYKYPSISVSQ
jgi:hypothetical protein